MKNYLRKGLWAALGVMALTAATPAAGQGGAQGKGTLQAKGALKGAETVYGDWARRCFKGDVCVIQTGLQVGGAKQGGVAPGRRIVAQLALAHNAGGALVAELRLPTGILIPKGLRANVAGLAFRPVLRTCISEGCLASFDVTKDVLSAMKKGKAFTVLYTQALTGAEIRLPFSLKGFEEGLEAFLKKKQSR